MKKFNHKPNFSKEINPYCYPNKSPKKSLNEKRRSKNNLFRIDLKKKKSEENFLSLRRTNSKHDIFTKRKDSISSLNRKRSLKNSFKNNINQNIMQKKIFFKKQKQEKFSIQKSLKNAENFSIEKSYKNFLNNQNYNSKNNIKNIPINNNNKYNQNTLKKNIESFSRKKNMENLSNNYIKFENKKGEDLSIIKNVNKPCDSSMISNTMILNIVDSTNFTNISILDEDEKKFKEEDFLISSNILKNVEISKPYEKIENPKLLENKRIIRLSTPAVKPKFLEIKKNVVIPNFGKIRDFRNESKNEFDKKILEEKIKNIILIKKQKIEILKKENFQTKEKISDLIKKKYLEKKNNSILIKIENLKNLLQKNPDLKQLMEIKLLYLNMKNQKNQKQNN